MKVFCVTYNQQKDEMLINQSDKVINHPEAYSYGDLEFDIYRLLQPILWHNQIVSAYFFETNAIDAGNRFISYRNNFMDAGLSKLLYFLDIGEEEYPKNTYCVEVGSVLIYEENELTVRQFLANPFYVYMRMLYDLSLVEIWTVKGKSHYLSQTNWFELVTKFKLADYERD